MNDSVVCVDRSNSPIRPDGWKIKVMYPELEMTGPTKFDVRRLDQWAHPDGQEKPEVLGSVILKYLEENNLLASCLGVSDLVAIQEKGLQFFRKHFHWKLVFGWKSITQVTYEDADDPELVVPYLAETRDAVGSKGKVVLCWSDITVTWDPHYRALRFPS